MIATLARRGDERGLDVFICHRRQGRPPAHRRPHPASSTSASNKVIDAAALKDDWGIRPDQVVDFLALTGDTVDNVPGVPGIGPEDGRDAPQGVRHAGEPAGERRQGHGRQDASRTSATTPRPPAGPGARHPARRPAARARLGRPQDRRRPTRKALKALCIECGFHGFLNEIGRRRRRRRRGRPGIADYRLVDTPESFAAFVDELQAPAQVLPRHRDDRRSTRSGPSWSASRSRWKEGEAYYLPVRGPDGSADARPGSRRSTPSGRSWTNPDDREGRPEPQVRHARPRPRGHRARPGRSPTRWSSATCSRAASGTTTSTSSRSACSTTR